MKQWATDFSVLANTWWAAFDVAHETLPPELLRRRRDRVIDHLQIRDVAEVYRAIFALDLGARMRQITARTLIIEVATPQEDHLGRQGEKLVKLVPDSRLATVEHTAGGMAVEAEAPELARPGLPQRVRKGAKDEICSALIAGHRGRRTTRQGGEPMTTRETLRQQGETMRSRLHGDRRPPAEIAAGESTPGFRQMMTEAVFGGIWARPGLALADRMICTLAALSLLQRLPQLRQYVAAALEAGLAPRTILELFVQCGLYGGFPITETAVTIAHEVFADRGMVVPDEPPRTDTLEALDTRGRALLQELHGARGSQGYAAPGNAVTGALYPTAIQYGYGELWFRPGLERRQRMLCAVASFTVLSLESQVKKFGQSALSVGLSRQEVIEAVIQTAPYGGFPRALNALAALSDVFSEEA